jgi:hypothetical protein
MSAAVAEESAEKPERADTRERTDTDERAVDRESAELSERAETCESADTAERANEPESAEATERAATHESAGHSERADRLESAETPKRAAEPESTGIAERAGSEALLSATPAPKYALGYPHIETDTHTLWDAQQAGWPEHLPHEAWAALIEVKNSEPKIKGSSADHPAFQAGYAPNYAATQEGVQPDRQPANIGAKSRR